MNQSLQLAIPEFIEIVGLWFDPRTKAMTSKLERAVMVYIERLDIKTSRELLRLAHLIVDNHDQQKWPSLKQLRLMMDRHDAQINRSSTGGKVIEKGSDAWASWESYYRATAPNGFRLKYMLANKRTQVPSEFPPALAQASRYGVT